jgi:acetyl-CoA synthetase
MVGFCVLVPGLQVTPNLALELRDRVGAELGKPLRPESVHFVTALPKTRNAKVMRRVIRAAWMGQDAGDLSALEDPGAIDGIRAAKESG